MTGIGQRAPDFSLSNQHGETVTRDGLAGPALLVFYPFAFSGICSSELGDLRDHRSRFDDAGVRIVAISCDPMFALRIFDDRDGFGFSLLSDFWPHGDTARAFGCFDDAMGAPSRSSFLLDADAVVRWSVAHEPGQRRDISLHVEALRQMS